MNVCVLPPHNDLQTQNSDEQSVHPMSKGANLYSLILHPKIRTPLHIGTAILARAYSHSREGLNRRCATLQRAIKS